MNKLNLTLLFVLLPLLIYAEESKFSISGNIYFNKSGSIIIYLVDEETSKVPFTGISKQEIIPSLQDIKRGYIQYTFGNIPKGIYGIRCFQDTNMNIKLDN